MLTAQPSRYKIFITRIPTAIFLLFAIVFIEVGTSDASEKIVLQLAWKHQFQFAGYYAALHKGYYRQAGLDVTIVEGGQGKFAREEVLSGRSQYGVAGAELLLHRREGNPFVVLAPIFQHSPSILLARRDTGISNIQDLVGKGVMLLPGDKDADILAAFLNEGVSLDAIHRLDQTYNLDDLIEGRTDAVSAYVTNEPWQLLQQGVEPAIISPQTSGVDFYSDCLFTTETEIRKHPRRVQAFLDASLLGWEYAMTHTQKIIDLLIAEYGVKKQTDHLSYEAEAIRKMILPELVQIGHMNPGRWRHIAEVYQKLGILDADFSLEGFLYDPGLQDDFPWLNRTFFAAIFVIVLLAIGTGFLVVFNSRLRSEVQERKQAEVSLKESENQISSIFRSAPVGIGSVVNRVLIKVNNRLCEMTGYDVTELIGYSSRMLYPSDEDFECVGREKYAQIADHGTGMMETHWQKKDGTIMDVLLSSAPVNLKDHTKGITFTALDITERKQAEEALKSNYALLQIAGETAKFGGWSVDLEKNTCIWSDAVADIHDVPHGYSPPVQEAINFYAPKWREKITQCFTACAQKGNSYVEEMEVITQKGKRVWVRTTGTAVKNEKGKIIKVQGSFQDITERKQAEQKYQTLFREMLNGFALHEIICDATGVPVDYRFLDVNPAFERMTGLKAQEIIGKTILEILPRTERHWIELYGKVAHTGEAAFFENYHAELSMHFEVTAFRPAPSQFACIFSDITMRKQAEAERERLQTQLLQAQKMESVGRLAGGVAHDFNNMLGVISGRAELGLKKTAPTDPVHKDLEQILNAADRSADITRQLLAFARKQTIAPKVIDLNDTVDTMLQMLGRLIGEHIDLQWQPVDDLWSVKMDPSQLDQILVNLCVNARDAIADVGKITIETGMKVFDTAYCDLHAGFVPGEFVLLAVSDDGCGMDRHTLGNLFEPFFTTKQTGRGTGMGLATVYGIIKQNNGFINVYSEPEKGSSFRIYLPRSTEDMAEKIPKKYMAPSPRGNGETILLVEDEATIMEMLEIMLESLNYKVIAANSPSRAMEMAHSHAGQIHLVITDVVMPEMNGRDLAEKLSTLYPGINVLFMSGYTANVIAHQGVLDEGVAFIQKPFSMADLSEKLREILDIAPDQTKQ